MLNRFFRNPGAIAGSGSHPQSAKGASTQAPSQSSYSNWKAVYEWAKGVAMKSGLTLVILNSSSRRVPVQVDNTKTKPKAVSLRDTFQPDFKQLRAVEANTRTAVSPLKYLEDVFFIDTEASGMKLSDELARRSLVVDSAVTKSEPTESEMTSSPITGAVRKSSCPMCDAGILHLAAQHVIPVEDKDSGRQVGFRMSAVKAAVFREKMKRLLRKKVHHGKM